MIQSDVPPYGTLYKPAWSQTYTGKDKPDDYPNSEDQTCTQRDVSRNRSQRYANCVQMKNAMVLLAGVQVQSNVIPLPFEQALEQTQEDGLNRSNNFPLTYIDLTFWKQV